jgi:hypothetical protein
MALSTGGSSMGLLPGSSAGIPNLDREFYGFVPLHTLLFKADLRCFILLTPGGAATFRQGGANQLIFARLRCTRVKLTTKSPDTMSVAGSKEGSMNKASAEGRS